MVCGCVKRDGVGETMRGGWRAKWIAGKAITKGEEMNMVASAPSSKASGRSTAVLRCQAIRPPGTCRQINLWAGIASVLPGRIGMRCCLARPFSRSLFCRSCAFPSKTPPTMSKPGRSSVSPTQSRKNWRASWTFNFTAARRFFATRKSSRPWGGTRWRWPCPAHGRSTGTNPTRVFFCCRFSTASPPN